MTDNETKRQIEEAANDPLEIIRQAIGQALQVISPGRSRQAFGAIRGLYAAQRAVGGGAGGEMSDQKFTHTVHCWTDISKRKHFTEKKKAVEYANSLLRAGEQCTIFEYRPRRTYGDLLAKEGPPPGMKLK